MSEGLTVLNLAMGADTGGQGVRTARAFTRVAPEWTVRAMARTRTYIGYPNDLYYSRRLAAELYGRADVVHLRNRFDGYRRFDRGRGIPIVLHHHGTAFRMGHEAIAAEARRIGAAQVVSTLDLAVLEPDVVWIPSPFNLDELARIREREYRDDGAIRIAHAPTSRPVKGTDDFLAVMYRLAERFPNVELVLIEGRPWAECLRRKARADIYYDQLDLGYGNNAVEAWGFGLPVVAGVADPAVRARMVATWGALPFLEATPDTFERQLASLISSAAKRREWADRGLAHVRRWHDERVVVPMLADVYLSAGPTVPFAAGRPWLAGAAA